MGLAYGEGYGAHLRMRGAPPYQIEDADALAYVAEMDVQPSSAIKRAIDELVIGLKADGLWAPIKLLALHCIHDNQAGRVNLKNPAHVGAPVGASGNGPDFLALNGFAGNGTDSKIGWGVTLGDLGCTGTSAFALVWSFTDNSGQNDFGGHPNIAIRGRAGSTILVRPIWNGNLQPTLDPPTSLGLYGWNKGSGNGVAVKNGAFIGTAAGAQTSGSLTTEITTCAGDTNYGTRRLAATVVGTTLSEAGHLALYNRLTAYMEAVHGTPVPF